MRKLVDQHPRFAIGHAGWAHMGPQQVAHRIDNQKALMAFDELTPINPNLLCGCYAVFDTLGVNDSYDGQRFFVRFKPVKYGQLIGTSAAKCHH